jgi:hypothetical protein
VPGPSVFEVEIVIKEIKRHKSPVIDQIPAEIIKNEAEKFALRSINLLIIF